MVAINRIDARVATVAGSDLHDTDDWVYLGLGGREFKLDTSAGDHDAGQNRTFRLGNQSNVTQAARNDPRSPQIDTDEVPDFPVYIRKPGTRRGQGEDSGDDGWRVESVDVTVNPGPNQLRYTRLVGPERIWLSNGAGLILYLKRV